MAESETDGWCLDAYNNLNAINAYAVKQGNLLNIVNAASIPHSIKISNKKSKITTNHMLNNGTYLVQGGYKKQLLVLTPILSKSHIRWKAYISPATLIPSHCRSLPSATLNIN